MLVEVLAVTVEWAEKEALDLLLAKVGADG